jgi:hypothetical protein
VRFYALVPGGDDRHREGCFPACERGGSACREMVHPSNSKLCTKATHCNYFLKYLGSLTIFNDWCKSATRSQLRPNDEIPHFWPNKITELGSFSPAVFCEFRFRRLQSLAQSFAVRSIADFSFTIISSTSDSLITSGGAKTIVSRIARQISPSLKQ